jgi:DNA polymerase lambda
LRQINVNIILNIVAKASVKVDYYITSNKIKIESLENKFARQLVHSDIIVKLYNLDWIINCAKEKSKLNTDPYKIVLAVKEQKLPAKRKTPDDPTIDQYFTQKKKIMTSGSNSKLSLKKEDFYPIQEKKVEEDGNASDDTTKSVNPKNSRDSTPKKSSKKKDDDTISSSSEEPMKRGFNNRLKFCLSQESINEVEEAEVQGVTNNLKSNNQLFDDIWNNIANLKKEGKDDEIFSHKSLDGNGSDDDISDTISVTSNSNSNISNSLSTSSKGKYVLDKSKFAFNAGSNKTNHNEHIITELEKILDFHANEGNVFESLAYRKAIAQLKNSNEKITSCDQLKNYKYLGKSIGKKIKEILLTGKLGKTDYLKDDERSNTLKLLTEVWGIGMSLANKLYRKNIKTIEDLRKNQDLLNKNQKVGLMYYEEIKQRIPRAECEEVIAIVKEEIFKILPEELLEIQLCGSYRRGKATCGDMDILITRKDEGGIEGILQTLVDKLMARELITDILQISNSSITKTTFFGVSQLEGRPHRRLDIKIYLKQFYPFALLYFTGSAYFNRSMRLFAAKIGYNLSDLGLHKVDGYRKNKVPTGKFVDCKTEDDIFLALGLDYKAPNERDI